MIFFYGIRTAKIGKYEDPHVKCEFCGEYKCRYIVSRQYFHLFWIPIIPLGSKEAYGKCANCGQQFYNEKTKHYLSMARTPLYLFLGLIFFIFFIGSVIYGSHADNKKKAEYIEHPMAGDEYLIRVDKADGKYYFFMKVDAVTDDSLRLIPGAYEYKRFVSKMVDEDYYNEEYFSMISKKELSEWLENGLINSVKR